MNEIQVRSNEVSSLLQDIRQLRNDLPEYMPNDEEAKNLINAYHSTQTYLLSRVQSLMGFDNFEQTARYVDASLRGDDNVA